jgi:hypothetical protein
MTCCDNDNRVTPAVAKALAYQGPGKTALEEWPTDLHNLT